MKLSLSHWYPGSGVVRFLIFALFLALSYTDFFFKLSFSKVLSGIPSECQHFVEPICKGHQPTTKNAHVYTYEPRHEISNNVVSATSKGSDQPAHTRSLIRALASRLNILTVKLQTEHGL